MPEYTLPCMLERDTVSLGKSIGAVMFPGAFLALYGELGSGKTTLTRAVADGMGIHGVIGSPSYTIVCEYQGEKLSLYHFDAYRIQHTSELIDIGFLDYCYKGGVIIMEWADNVSEALPKERLDIYIKGSGSEQRTMVFVPHGAPYVEVLKETVI